MVSIKIINLPILTIEIEKKISFSSGGIKQRRTYGGGALAPPKFLKIICKFQLGPYIILLKNSVKIPYFYIFSFYLNKII